jgi:hypothetical protein
MLDTTSRVDPASLFDDNKPRCDQCGEPFEPRTGNGGKPQRFCSSECRIAFHNEPQRGQRSPTCIAPSLLAAVEEPKPKDASAATREDGFSRLLLGCSLPGPHRVLGYQRGRNRD